MTGDLTQDALDKAIQEMKDAGIDPVYRGPIYVAWDLARGSDYSVEVPVFETDWASEGQ